MEWHPQELRLLAAVVKAGSFRKGAASLGVAPSSASHVVRRLEERLGVRLLNRTTRSVAPTAIGARLVGQINVLLNQMEQAFVEAAAETQQVSGSLIISAPTLAARHLLRAIVPRFRRAYPEVELELRAEDRTIDIVADGCDAGIRLRYAVPADMIAVPLGGPIRFVVIATPNYIAQVGAPRTPEDLLEHECVRVRLPSGALYAWQFERDGEQLALHVPGKLVLDRAELMVEAALGSVGFAYAFEDLVSEALAAHRLVTVLDEWCCPEPGLTLYYPGHRNPPPALRAFIDLVRMPEINGLSSPEKG